MAASSTAIHLRAVEFGGEALPNHSLAPEGESAEFVVFAGQEQEQILFTVNKAMRWQRLKREAEKTKALFEREPYTDAEEAFKKVIQMKPDFCYAMVNLSKVYLATKRWKEAEAQSKEAAQCAPRLAVNFDNLGFRIDLKDHLLGAAALW